MLPDVGAEGELLETSFSGTRRAERKGGEELVPQDFRLSKHPPALTSPLRPLRQQAA